MEKRGERYRYLPVKICDFSDYADNDETKALYEFNQRRQRLYYCPDLTKPLTKADGSIDEENIDQQLHVKGTVFDKTIS